jgi:hypothetical protein
MTAVFDIDFHDKITSVTEESDDVAASTQVVFKFTNGYSASVIQGRYTYGGDRGLFEMAVLDPSGHIDYENPVTPDDVAGYLSVAEVKEKLHQLAHLTETELVEFRKERAKAAFLKALEYLAADFRDVRRNTPDAVTELPDELRQGVETILAFFDNENADNEENN